MDLGPSEVVLILLVMVLLFGAKRLPDLARSTGRALRIFREETRALGTDSANPGGATSANTSADVSPGDQGGPKDSG